MNNKEHSRKKDERVKIEVIEKLREKCVGGDKMRVKTLGGLLG